MVGTRAGVGTPASFAVRIIRRVAPLRFASSTVAALHRGGPASRRVRKAADPHIVLAARMNDETMLLTHARRYFRAAAECEELRKMEVLVELGRDYLKLAARLNGFKAGSVPARRIAPTADAPSGPGRGVSHGTRRKSRPRRE
jgi:hypothetical protein